MPPRNPFTDPFVLFNSMFGDLNRHIHEPFMQFSHGDTFDDPRGHGGAPHEPLQRANMFSPGGPGPMPGPFSPTAGMGVFGGTGTSRGVPQRFHSESTFRANSGRYGWQRESRVTTTVNGVTQSKWIRVDSDVSLHMPRQ
jgi:DnaJ family protein B protein 6